MRSFKVKILRVIWNVAATLAGLALVALVLWEAFETILLPRTVTRRFRFTRFFFRALWPPWVALGRRIAPGAGRERYLGLFGPLSILLLIGCWAVGLVAGFGLWQWALRPDAHGPGELKSSLYLSGTTFFTLGLGGVKPETAWARFAVMLEAGLGFGFLASIISYLPVIYTAFSLREVTILRLDVRAGSPPTAGALLRQHAAGGDGREFDALLLDFEKWAAGVLESYLSYPVLCLYRSQHRDQSWLATLTAILDTCALLIVGVDGVRSRQAPVTFAMARRALIDIAHLFRLGPGDKGEPADRLRATYEPSAHDLSAYLLMPLPPWLPPADAADRPTSASEQFFEEEGATDVSIV